MGVSEVRAIREQIINEYMAAKLGLSGLAAGSSTHTFITSRQERIGGLHAQLTRIVGEEEATRVLVDTLETIPEQEIRANMVMVLIYSLGETEETRQLMNRIAALWGDY